MKKKDVVLLDLKFTETTDRPDMPWVVSMRFIDLNNYQAYDKSVTFGCLKLSLLVRMAAWYCTVVCSIDDPYDMDALNKAFAQMEL